MPNLVKWGLDKMSRLILAKNPINLKLFKKRAVTPSKSLPSALTKLPQEESEDHQKTSI
jgi:hypothetical protein